MAVTIVFDMYSSSVEIVKDHAQNGQDCRILRVHSADGNQINFHFEKVEDIAAFVGLQVIATGVNLDDLPKSYTTRT